MLSRPPGIKKGCCSHLGFPHSFLRQPTSAPRWLLFYGDTTIPFVDPLPQGTSFTPPTQAGRNKANGQGVRARLSGHRSRGPANLPQPSFHQKLTGPPSRRRQERKKRDAQGQTRARKARQGRKGQAPHGRGPEKLAAQPRPSPPALKRGGGWPWAGSVHGFVPRQGDEVEA